MCQYSSVDGFSNDWHFVHLGTRAVGGAALVLTEASAVTADGRISPHDLGIYDDRHVDGLARIASASSTRRRRSPARSSRTPDGRRAPRDPGMAAAPCSIVEGGWQPVGPTADAVCRQLPDAARAGRGRHRRDRRGVQGRRPARARGRLRRRRAARGARLPDSRISLTARQHADRRLRRVVRQPRPPVSRDRRRRAGGLARAPAAVRPDLGDRLEGGRLGSRAGGRTRAAASRARRRSGRLLVWRRGVTISRSRSVPATRCRSPSASAATPACRPAPSG